MYHLILILCNDVIVFFVKYNFHYGLLNCLSNELENILNELQRHNFYNILKFDRALHVSNNKFTSIRFSFKLLNFTVITKVKFRDSVIIINHRQSTVNHLPPQIEGIIDCFLEWTIEQWTLCDDSIVTIASWLLTEPNFDLVLSAEDRSKFILNLKC